MDQTMEHLIDRFCEAWSEFDAARRERLLREVCDDQARYTDPRGEATGVAELTAFIGQILAGRPGAKVVRTTAVDSHHRLARFGWRVVQADGTVLREGIDFAEISPAGKLARITGFVGPLAPM
jgi:SnoaL-like domain